MPPNIKLPCYPEWDALSSVAADPDIVVQFDGTPVRVVFWRGMRYSRYCSASYASLHMAILDKIFSTGAVQTRTRDF